MSAVVEVRNVLIDEPLWCHFCGRQAHYEVGWEYACGRHILMAVRKGLRAGADGGHQ